MATSTGFLDHVKELLAPLGAITVRRMFGSAGVYVDGLIIGLASDDILYLKTDIATRVDFENEGMKPFTYATKDGEQMLISYWRAPEWLFDDGDEMVAWARRALGVSRAAAAAKAMPEKSRSRKGRPAKP